MSSSLSSVQKHYHDYVVNGGGGPTVWKDRAKDLGYNEDLLPSNLTTIATTTENEESLLATLFQASCGSGCPLQLLAPQSGQTVMDLGCGAGHDVLLARHAVGPTGKVIGVDFCPGMIVAAKDNLAQWRKSLDWLKDDDNDDSIVFVESNFERDSGCDDRLAEYRGAVDMVMSNGVLNLCRDKKQVFDAIFQLLKPGGNLVFSDVCQVLTPNPHAPIACSVGDVFSS